MYEELKKLGFNIKSRSIKNLSENIYENRIDDDTEHEDMKVFRHSLDYNLESLKDVDVGAKILIKHIDNRSHIAVVSDYDADGLTSAVTLTKGLLEVFACDKNKVTTIINKRKLGNGFNPVLTEDIIKLHKQKPIDLIITSDHGSVDNPSYLKFKEAGIGQIIVTDHHTCEHGIPDQADAFINPQRDDSTYLKKVSGCAVAFLLILKTYKDMFKTDNFRQLYPLLPYVGISTITDVMSIKEPYNRYLVKLGLRELNSLKNKTWIPIKKILGISGLVTVKDIGFKIGPLINSGNAMDDEQLVFRMLIEANPNKTYELAKEVNVLNTLRKNITRDLNKEALKQIDTKYGLTTIVDSSINVNGKVASAVGSQLNRPIVCFSEPEDNKEVYTGSGRGIVNNFHILNVVNKINSIDNSILLQYGGHKGALGCKIHKSKYNEFKTLFDKFCKEELEKMGSDDVINVDMVIPAYMINVDLYNKVMEYYPYGLDWEEPVFLSTLKIKSIIKIYNFVKIIFSRKNGNDISGIYFFNDRTTLTPDNISELRGKELPVAYTVRLNNFRNIYSVELEVVKIGIGE